MFFLEFSCFFYNPTDVGNLVSGSINVYIWNNKFYYNHLWSFLLPITLHLNSWLMYCCCCCCYCLVTKSCPTVCNPMNCSPQALLLGFLRQEHCADILRFIFVVVYNHSYRMEGIYFCLRVVTHYSICTILLSLLLRLISEPPILFLTCHWTLNLNVLSPQAASYVKSWLE